MPAEQIEAFRTNGFVVVDDLLTGDELDTFEPLLTAAVAYSLGRRRAHTRGTPNGTYPTSRGLVPAPSSRPIRGPSIEHFRLRLCIVR